MANQKDTFSSALNALSEPVFIAESSGSCLFINAAMEALLRGSVPGGATTSEFWPAADALLSKREEFSTEFLTKDGDSITVKLILNELGSERVLGRVLASTSDSSSREGLHHQRLETLGMLAGGVAHDFNNILAGILGHITYLKTILPGQGDHVESLKAIEDGSRKASGLTQQILNFSKLDAEDKASVIDLTALVESTASLLRRAISPKYEITVDLPEQPINLLGIEAELAQVLVNLVVNARDALGDEGKIDIKLCPSVSEQDLAQAFPGVELTNNAYAVLSVSDNGSGIPKEVLDRIFEPYFSTKKGKGTGLGLATVGAIVECVGGAIVIDSRLNQGTTISIYLPLIDGDAEVQPAQFEEPEMLSGGSEAILVVDDEYPVRNVLSMSLRHLGYEVELASSGAEALEKYTQRAGGYDLVILDMLMPGLSGEQVFEKLKEMDPGVQVLLISGFSSEEAVRGVLDGGGKDFIQKPFTIEELARKVRECVE